VAASDTAGEVGLEDGPDPDGPVEVEDEDVEDVETVEDVGPEDEPVPAPVPTDGLELHPATAPAVSRQARTRPDRRRDSMSACWHVRPSIVRRFTGAVPQDARSSI
jgi:hypothetical protein